jgi:pathogenesis-related protein 1
MGANLSYTVGQFKKSSPQPSHFTQVVWKGTRQVGCAHVSCAPGKIFPAKFGSAAFHVCEYSPPGNVIGQFEWVYTVNRAQAN